MPYKHQPCLNQSRILWHLKPRNVYEHERLAVPAYRLDRKACSRRSGGRGRGRGTQRLNRPTLDQAHRPLSWAPECP